MGNIDSNDNSSQLDCSNSPVTNPNNSLIPKFRRQWVVKNNFPNTKDISIAVIIVNPENNQITRTFIITKSDGNTK